MGGSDGGGSVLGGAVTDLPVSLAVPSLRDLLALVKPRITLMLLCTTVGGLYFAPGRPALDKVLLVLLGTALVVGGANALNMYLERVSDGLMRRTQNRPLPSGRVSPRVALWFGVGLGVASMPILAIGANPLTALLGAIAFVSYVLVYTPMKKRSPMALFVGAVPGAMPPLMGWTAATGSLDAPGLVLFAIMCLWQVPHFLAITFYASEDFERGGIKVMPLVESWGGVKMARRTGALFAAALVPTSLLLVRYHVAGLPYLVVALVGGGVFFGWSAYGLRRDAGRRWARSLFLVSLVYVTALFVALAFSGGR